MVTPRAVAEFIAQQAPESSDDVDALLSSERRDDPPRRASPAPPPKRKDGAAGRRAGLIAVGTLFICAGLLLLDSVGTDVLAPAQTTTSEQVVVGTEPMPCPLPSLDMVNDEPDESALRRSGESSGKAKSKTSLDSQPQPKTVERSAVLDFGI